MQRLTRPTLVSTLRLAAGLAPGVVQASLGAK